MLSRRVQRPIDYPTAHSCDLALDRYARRNDCEPAQSCHVEWTRCWVDSLLSLTASCEETMRADGSDAVAIGLDLMRPKSADLRDRPSATWYDGLRAADSRNMHRPDQDSKGRTWRLGFDRLLGILRGRNDNDLQHTCLALWRLKVYRNGPSSREIRHGDSDCRQDPRRPLRTASEQNGVKRGPSCRLGKGSSQAVHEGKRRHCHC